MNNKTISFLKSRETIRLKKLSNLNSFLDLNDYLKNQSIFSDDYLYYSSYEFFNHLNSKKITYFYTPEWLIYFMIDKAISNWLKNQDNCLKNIRILNPFCGSGFFTHILVEYLFIKLKFLYPKLSKKNLLKKIIQEHIFSWDIRSEAVALCQHRIKNIFDVEAINVKQKNLFLENQKFDIIIGIPPTHDLISTELKETRSSSHTNILLDFINHSKSLIQQNGNICFLTSHEISYLPNFVDFRKSLYVNKNLYSVTDIDVNFQNINYEALVIHLNNQENLLIESSSFKDLNYKESIPKELFYEKYFNYKFNLYWDNYYQLVQDSFPQYPLLEINISKKILKNLSITDLCEKFLNIGNCSSIEEYKFYIKRYIFNNHKEIYLNQYILKQIPFLNRKY